MPLFKTLATARYLRALHQTLAHVASALDEQNQLLRRLADHFAPLDPATDRTEVRADTGVTYHDPFDEALAESYRTRMYNQTGHMPDDDEVLIYLADEKTTDLHTRLAERDDELARLAQERR